MNNHLENEEKLLLDLLSMVFSEKTEDEFIEHGKSDINWQKLFDIAEKHSVLSLLYDVLDGGAGLSPNLQNRIKTVSTTIVLQNYNLFFLGRTIITLLKNENIDALILKGSGTAELYPVPELRKSGDLDILLLNRADIEKAEQILLKAGLTKESEQLAHHHVGFFTKQGIEVEVHVMLAEPFDNYKSNRYFDGVYNSCRNHVCEKEIMGVSLPMLDDGYHIFYLMLHMLQHFLRSGFGIKLFCDWIAFWRREVSEEACETFMKLSEESGLLKFAKMVTASCIGYLGLSADKMKFMFGKVITEDYARRISKNIITEVLEAQEFGKSSADRMVMTRGGVITGFVREFHHQMHLNFPKAGKVFIFWPVLWIITLFRFMINNKKLRNISGMAILKKTAERNKLMNDLELFK